MWLVDLQLRAVDIESFVPQTPGSLFQAESRMVQFGAIRSRLITMNNREKQGIWAIFVPILPFFDVVTFYISNG